PAKSRIVPEPLGRTLIISPWNYPFQLAIAPLIGAIAAGNVAVIKPSEMAPHTAALLEQMINQAFAPEYVHVKNGGVEFSQQLLECRWDHIFFTGSTAIGKVVAAAAARNLTPCTLELGGKSPCIVTRNAHLEVTARRIVFGKFLNAGQTCVAPDYILVEDTIHDALIEALRKEITLRFGSNPLGNEQLPRIINERHFQRLMRLIEPGKVNFGGRADAGQLLIEPTLLTGVQRQDPVMQEEIFGPILPIIPVKDLSQAKKFILGFEKPLAFYLFSDSQQEQTDVINSVSFGGGCINDTLMHLANPNLPFGGVGASGAGAYHGEHSFDAFSHKKSVVMNSSFFDLPVRYFPWIKSKDKVLRLLLK
ncbi:MAG: aldehyde dehydrogenase family protein, partial [Pseudobdellovibrionaceae bacterium]|nr:aldehyde dehydrogenase family protein [Pseudobdellovibrionaceae bacterium]